MSPEQPADLHPGMQMRIPYSAPLRDQRWRMVLRGMQVQLTPEDGDTQTALEYLRCIGCFPSADELGVISVPVTEIRKVLDLPERVVIIPNGDLITLLGLLRSSPTHTSNVLVSADSHQVLNLNWFSAGLDHNEPIGVGAVPALLSAGVPLVADEETWEIIHRSSPLPSARASARVNLDGFIEISTPVPQHLEALAIPGLFRLDDSRFGVPLLHASTLRSIPGLIWDGRPPSYDPPPRRSPHLPITLNEHSREHVRSLTDRMSVARSQAVLWPPGSGRRVFSLAAMEQLGAFPLYVLTLPSNMWLWHRHMELFGRSYTLSPLTGSSAPDVRLLPYTELATTRRLDHPAGMILDCLDVALAEGLCRSDDMARFDGSVDAYRIAPVNSLPKEPQKLMELLSCLRPVEFPRLLPAAYRYPSPVEQRLWEHAEVYVHTSSDAPDVSMFRQSRVLRVEPPIWWGEEIARLPSIERGASLNRRERLEELLRLQSAGSESQVGPKVAHAISLASAATTEGRATAILTSVSNTADLLRGLLPPSDLLRIMHVTLDAGDIEEVRVTASSAEVVVVVDLPPCFAALDDILVPASDSQGPSVIYMLHMNGGMDDRLAVIASIRATTARFAGNKPYTTREIDYLLGDIHLEEVLA